MPGGVAPVASGLRLPEVFLSFAAASYLALAAQATFAGGLTPAGAVLSAVLLLLETAALLLAGTFAFET